MTDKDLAILLDTLKPAAPHWKALGLALGFQNYELTTIERTPLLIPEGLTGYFREMLGQWLKWATPIHSWPTLEDLALALQKNGHEGLAVQLRQTLLQKKGIGPATVTKMLVHVCVWFVQEQITEF